MDNRTTFGVWMRQRRKERGVTYDELAEQIGCSRITLIKIEAGERRPSRQIAQLLADYCHIPADEREAFITFARAGQATSTAASSDVGDTQHGMSTGSQATPWRRAYVYQTNLPAMLTLLIGRDRELSEARELILHPKTRLLTFTGAPGIGKTRLATQVASDLVEYFEDGIYFVDLAPIADPDLVLPTVAYTLGLKDEANRSLEHTLFDFVRDRRMMLLLDNFEQVLDAAYAIVRLMQASPWLKIVVTSREGLHVRGERRFTIPPLKAPNLGPLPHQDLLVDYASVQLFVERAQAVEHDFILDESNTTAVAEICRRLGGLPLAIELIAARTRLFSPYVLLSRLEKLGDLGLLTGGARDLPARHRSLRGAIAWSYNLLNLREQITFRRLGVFAGGFTTEAALKLCKEADDLSLDPLEDVASLLDKSLLISVKEQASDPWVELNNSTERAYSPRSESRFLMLETLREYSLEKLREEEEMEEAQRRHALYFMELAEEAEPELKGPDQAGWLARLQREYSNIRAALNWSSDYDAEITIRLMYALMRFWYIRGHYAEGREWLEKVLAKGDDVPVLMRAKALRAASSFPDQWGNQGLGVSYLEESVALAHQAGDKALISNVQGQLGYVLLERGDRTRAKALFEECLILDRELEDKYGVCWLLTALGEVARSEEDYAQSREYYEEGLLLAREAENKYNIAHLVGNLGSVALAEGDYGRATSLFVESLTLAQELDFRTGIVARLTCFASLAVALGLPVRAAKLSGAVARLLQTIDSGIDAVDQHVYEHYVASARSQLGAEVWAAASAEGQAMSMEEAVAYALDFRRRTFPHELIDRISFTSNPT